ncbi:hypothetical protein GQ600_6229 [Phytophthora cactorum]|nr:hypothetical protein GQ600_6229 [Phytophthora cactorum]
MAQQLLLLLPEDCTQVDATVVVEVAPAVVFLLLGATLLRRLKTRRAIDQAHSRILDRLLGTQGATTTRDIRHLLAGIAPLAEHPRPTITLTWMTHGPDKMSVAVSVTSFISVFYKDGNRVAPTDLRLGNHFWEDPSMDSPRVKPLPTQPRALQTDPLPATNSPPTESHTAPQAADYGGTAEVEDTTPSDRSRFVDFMDALEETNAVQNSVGHSMTGPPLPDATRTDGAPRGTRRRDESTAGTADASMRILAALSEHPDLLQHYARQMSVAGQETKRPRYSTLGVLGTNSSTHTRVDRVSAAKDFAEELSDYEPWSSTEVKTLAFWFSNIFAAYRLASEHDLDYDSSTRLHVRSRLSMQDPELDGLLLKMLRQNARPQTSGSSASTTHKGNRPAAQPPARALAANPKESPKRPVPTEVGLAAPRQGGKQLCLRFISARRCPPSSPDRCTHSFLSHFVPQIKLDPVGIQEQLHRTLLQEERTLRAGRLMACIAAGVEPPATPDAHPATQQHYRLDGEAKKGPVRAGSTDSPVTGRHHSALARPNAHGQPAQQGSEF